MRNLNNILVLAFLASLAWGQEPATKRNQGSAARLVSVEGGYRLFPIKEDIHAEEILVLWNNATSTRLSWSPLTFKEHHRARFSGIVEIDSQDLDRFFESMLQDLGFGLIPSGSPQANVYQVYPMGGDRSPFIMRAKLVEPDEAARCAQHPARFFLTHVTARHAEANEIAYSLNGLLRIRCLEIVAVNSSNRITISGFGPTVANAVELVRKLDQPLPETVAKSRSARFGKPTKSK